MKHKFIGIAGNIGVGKTTFTKMLCERFGWDPHYEVVVDNPYLKDFYGDMLRWSFNLQIYFLSKRFQVQKKIHDLDNSIVQDRTIYEDAKIFARSIHDMKKMDDRDWENYQELFHEMTSYLRPPDLIVYLRASTDSLISRIKKRGRDYEQNIDLAYLHRLNIYYDRWINELSASKEIPVLIIETDGKDFCSDQVFCEDVFRKIYNKLNSHEVSDEDSKTNRQ
ncbi:MAG: deoxynucleoside kinase [FCB group bacterium]|nr:deoxynucleoside kinase [FCB group bacterium]